MFRAKSGSNSYAPHLPGIGVNPYANDAYFSAYCPHVAVNFF